MERGEFMYDVYTCFKSALKDAYDNKYIGKNILNTNITITYNNINIV